MADDKPRYIRFNEKLWRDSMSYARSRGSNVSEMTRNYWELLCYDEDTALGEELAAVIQRLTQIRKRLQS